MKAVIVEVREKFVAALADDGCVKKLKNQNYRMGQVIEMKKPILKPKLIASLAGIAAVVALSSISAYAYYTPYSYVSLDVNPSIEYSVNRFDRVLSCNAVNGDGKAILDKLNLKNKTIEDAVQETVQEIADNGYLTSSEQGGIVIAASSDNNSKADELADTLKDEATSTTKEKGITADVETLSIGKERVKEAKDLGVTPGKLNLVQKLQASNPDENIDINEWVNQPVKDIMKAIKENKKADKATEKQESKPETTPSETTAITDTSVTADQSTAAGGSAAVVEKGKPAEKPAVSNKSKNKNDDNAKSETTVTASKAESETNKSEANDKSNPSNSNVKNNKPHENSGKSNNNNN